MAEVQTARPAGAPEAENKSALQDNIEKKGKNAYYFAHAHKATGPKWDGKPEPKLLSKQTSSSLGSKTSSFDYLKSNITSYGFLNNEKNVKLYVELEGIGEKCQENDIELEFTESSFSLVINKYSEEPKCLRFARLSGKITNAAFKLKPDRIILTLTKETPGKEWHTVNDKGTPDHEVV